MNQVISACSIVNSECKSQRGPNCSTITANVNAITNDAMQLYNFCGTLNREHKEDYGDFIDPELDGKIKKISRELICIIGELPISVLST